MSAFAWSRAVRRDCSRSFCKEIFGAGLPSILDQGEWIGERAINDIPIIYPITGPYVQGTCGSVLQRFRPFIDMRWKSHFACGDSERSLVELLSSTRACRCLWLVYELIEKGSVICPLPIYNEVAIDFYLVAPSPHFNTKKWKLLSSGFEREVKEVDSFMAKVFKE